MAALMGRVAWYGTGCCCCGGARTQGQVRSAERRAWLADWSADMADAEAERYTLQTLSAMGMEKPPVSRRGL